MAQETKKTSETEIPEGAMPEGALPGQITSPNPVEVFWEKHKVKVWIGLAIVGLAYAGMKFVEYQRRMARNETWTRVTASTGLNANLQPENYGPFGASMLLQKFDDSLKSKSVDELRKAADASSDTGAKATILWFLARRHAIDGEVSDTKSTLSELEKLAPKFPAFSSREAPPVYIEIPEIDEDDPKSRKAAENPPLPTAAKLSDRLIAMAERQAEFKSKHAHLYTVPTPAEKPIVRMETSEGTIVIRFFKDKAPKHVAQFVKNCKDKVYDEMSFHKIVRMGTNIYAPLMFKGGELAYFGDPETKQDDRSKWGQFKSEEQIEDELSGISHFPFVLAAERDSEKKGSDTQLAYFTATSAADRDEGNVVFGLVVEGQEVVKAIVSKPFSSAQETENGSGVPATAVTIRKVTVEE